MANVSLNLVAGSASAPTRKRRVAAPVRAAPARPGHAKRRRYSRAVMAAQIVAGADLSAIVPHLVAVEGKWGIALRPAASGGYEYALCYWQPITAAWIVSTVSADRDAVLRSLDRAACRYGEGCNVHALLCGYPLDGSGLTAGEVAALPFGMEWR